MKPRPVNQQQNPKPDSPIPLTHKAVNLNNFAAEIPKKNSSVALSPNEEKTVEFPKEAISSGNVDLTPDLFSEVPIHLKQLANKTDEDEDIQKEKVSENLPQLDKH